jgi:uncharacterized protein YqgC (DUF456 family)
MIDILLAVLGLILIIVGMIGSFLPVLPGPPIAWLGLLSLYFTTTVPIPVSFLIITGIVAVVMVILDYIIPAVGTKRFGGSKAGAIGTTIGLIVGIIAPIPMGILIGPFVGAFVGEVGFNNTDSKKAVKAATGSVLGFLASSFMKFVVCLGFLGLFFFKIFAHFSALFQVS